MKGAQMQKGNYSQEEIAWKDNVYLSTTKREPFYKGPRSHLGLSNDDFYNTPKIICQEKVVQPHALTLGDRNNNDLFQHSRNPFMSDYSPKRERLKHLELESF